MTSPLALRVFVIHGLATSHRDALAFERDVETVLFERRIPAIVHLGEWGSTGSIGKDLFLLARKQVAIVDALRAEFEAWLADLHPSAPALVLGHSFGCVVARRLCALYADRIRARGERGGPFTSTLLTLADPSRHPLLSLGLPHATAIQGLDCVSVVNPEDRVAALRGQFRALDGGWVTKTINFARAAPDRSRAHSGIVAGLEHDPISYLKHVDVARLIARAAGMDTISRPLPRGLERDAAQALRAGRIRILAPRG